MLSKKKNFSNEFKIILDNSKKEALRLGHDYIGQEHFLLGLMKNKECLPMQVLMSLNINLEDLKQRIEESISKSIDFISNLNIGNVNINDKSLKTLQYAVLEARQMLTEDAEAQPEHLMLSLLKMKGTNVYNILYELSIDCDKFKQMLIFTCKIGLQIFEGFRFSTIDVKLIFCRDFF